MHRLGDSLSRQHDELDRRLEQAIGAGHARRWSEYRSHFAALRDGLLRHMAFEDEALYPMLEGEQGQAVRELRGQHAQLRRLVEMVGAAVPEQDPDGCLAVLDQLAALLRRHHEEEMALDPLYATRPIPDLPAGAGPAMDLRGLQPPEPIVRIFQALERGDAPLHVILPHEPVPLYSLLKERGYSWCGAGRPDGGYDLTITAR